MMYFLATAAASGIFIAAGWRSKHSRNVAAAHGRYGLPFDPLWGDAEIDIKASEAHADVDAAIRSVLKRLAPVMASRSVQAEIASPSGLLVRMRSAALADLLEELLAAAIQSAPASRMLLTADMFGDRVHVNITDDMPGADPAVRQGSVRGLTERVALCGGALDVKVRPAEGTTMTLCLAAAMTARPNANGRPLPAPGKQLPDSINGSSVRAEQ
jgi:hypothetical protein